MRLLFLALMIITVSSLKGYGQSITFNERLSLGCSNTVFTGVEVTDSCYYLTGFARDSTTCFSAALFAVFDTLGVLKKLRVTRELSNHYETWAPTLMTNLEGNLVVSAYNIDSGNIITGGFIEYDHEGNLIGQNLYQDPYGGNLIRPDDMALTPDSGYILANTLSGQFWGQDRVSDMEVLKLDKYKQIEWRQIKGVASTVESRPSILLDTDSTYIIGYSQYAVTGSPGTSILKSHIERLDKNGDTLWTYTSPNDQQIYGVNDLVHTEDSGFVAASAWGYERVAGSGSAYYLHHSYLYKLNQQGQLEWDRVFYSDGDDKAEFTKLIELEDSSIVAFGHINRVYPAPTYGIRIGRIIKVSPRGDSLWNREYDYLTTGGARHIPYDAEQTPDGGFLIAGEANGVGSGVAQQGWLLKIDEHGCLVPGCHILSTTAPEPQEQLELQLYPNPCQQYLNVYYPVQEATGKTLEWRLIDVQGRVVQYYERPDAGAKTYIFEVQGLSTGVYFLELRRDGEILATEEVVKQ